MMFKKKDNRLIRYFVSIGAGINQLPLINQAKKLGFNIIGVDFNPTASGFIKCDLKIVESIENYDDIYVKLSEQLFEGTIRGIMTRSYGKAVITASFLNEKFRIPFIPFHRSMDFVSKKRMKETFTKNNILTPGIFNFTSRTRTERLDDNIFPLIKKPVIGHGKTGVKIIYNHNELKNFLPVKGEKEKFLFEKYIEGDEIIAVGIVHSGKYHIIDITDKVKTPHPSFVDIMHISPSRYYNRINEVSEIGQTVADSFDITSSPLIMEIIIDNNGMLSLIEAVPEFGGEFLSDILIPSRTGYSMIDQSILSTTGVGFKIPPVRQKRGAVVVKYIIGENGSLLSFNPNGPSRFKSTIYSRIFKEIGSEVKNPETNHDRVGVVITRGASVENAIENADKAIDSFNITIKEEF
jgi:biotin carboxylase